MIDSETFRVASWLPCGSRGRWHIRRYHSWGMVNTCLVRDDKWWMDDCHIELQDTAKFLLAARGSVLITGLGMGAVPAWLSRKDGVREIHIVEQDTDVIALVLPHLLAIAPQVVVIEADATQWIPSQRYDIAWHDIWFDSRLPAVQPEIAAMLAQYGPYCDEQMVWIPSTPARVA